MDFRLGFLVWAVTSTAPAVWSQTPLLTIEGTQPGSEYGYALGNAGDENGDGQLDLFVGAPLFDPAGEPAITDAGQAVVVSLSDGSVLRTFTGIKADSLFGASLDGGRDVNGDGVFDFAVGAPDCVGVVGASCNNQNGKAFLFSGADGSELFSLSGNFYSKREGMVVKLMPDYDGDGLAEFLSSYSSGQEDVAGNAVMYGLNSNTESYEYLWHTSYPSGWWLGSWGHAVDSGDFDGDGVSDILVGMADSPFVVEPRVYSGATGESPWPVGQIGDTEFYGPAGHQTWVTRVNDVNGNGIDDLAAAGRTTFSGNVELVMYCGLNRTRIWERSAPNAVLEELGDFDGDGAGDLMLGDPLDDTQGTDAGAVYLVSGADGSTVSILYGDQAGDRFGTSLKFLGDLNSDGLRDFAVGAPGGDYVRVFASFQLSAPEDYCVGKTTSQGCTLSVDWAGSPTLTGADNFLVLSRNALVGKPGLFFYGASGRINVPFLGGSLCVNPPLTRTIPTNAAGAADCEAGYIFPFTQALMLEDELTIGSRINGQFWTRDPQNPDGSGVALSNGIEFTILP